MEVNKYLIFSGEHYGEKVLLINFQVTDDFKARFDEVKWSKTKKSWYLPDTSDIRKELGISSKEWCDKLAGRIHPVNRPMLQRYYNQLILNGYSTNTIRLYMAEFASLLSLLKNRSVNTLTTDRLKDYFFYCATDQEWKERKLNGSINAIKFYYEEVLKQPTMFLDIPRPAPKANNSKKLTKAEIDKLNRVVTNTKHMAMMELCYGLGLRLGEISSIKKEDVNYDEARLLIHGAEGSKNRFITLPYHVVELLKKYMKEYEPKEWLFEGQNKGQYSEGSIQKMFKRAMIKAGINKNVGLHGIRNSYETRLQESGADDSFIKELLEQKKSKKK